jgi:nucleoside-diphosphate-sugar epimerase
LSGEWVYSKDAAHGTVLALKARSLPSRVFNITMGAVASPDDIVSALDTVIQGAKVRVETPAAAAISLPDMTHPSDLRLAQSVLGYAPRFGLLESLRDFIAWMAAREGSRE